VLPQLSFRDPLGAKNYENKIAINIKYIIIETEMLIENCLIFSPKGINISTGGSTLGYDNIKYLLP